MVQLSVTEKKNGYSFKTAFVFQHAFHIRYYKLLYYLYPDLCWKDEFHCGKGFCIESSAECNGFNDCQINNADEICGLYDDNRLSQKY